MNYNHNHQPKKGSRIALTLTACLLIVCAIIYMKRSTTEEKARTFYGKTSTASHPIAIPDTSIGSDVLSTTPDTIIPSTLSDTLLGKDKREPFEAGYEDGYAAGCDDGATDNDHAMYDESNNFHKESEQADYVSGYREGYAKGVEDGKEGRQFNI